MKYCIALILLLSASIVSAKQAREVGGMSITGNSELPHNIIIVPWKQQTLSANIDLPQHSLTDEAFAPIDRQFVTTELELFKVRNQK